MSAVAGTRSLRIGELAELTGTTPRTIRYYEEIGLLGGASERQQGKHRLYNQADVERMGEILRLRDLLGLSLEQLSQLLEAESARAEIRREYRATEDPGDQRRLLDQALGHLDRQLELLDARRREIEQLQTELGQRRARVLSRIAELETD